MKCGGHEESIALREAESGEAKARDVECVSVELGCLCVCSDYGRCLL